MENQNTNKYDLKVEIQLLGKVVGKTTLLRRYINGLWAPNQLPTIGCDLVSKCITLNNKKLKLNILDTYGLRYSLNYNYIPFFLRKAQGVMVLFDVTDYTTFMELNLILNEIELNCKKGTKRILIGTRIDLVDIRQVSYDEAAQFAQAHDMMYIKSVLKQTIM